MTAPNVSGLLDHYLAVGVAALDPVPGKQFVLAGAEPPWDQCDCDGQVWVRLVQIVPAIGVRKANGQPCNVLHWETTLAIGVIRCVAQPATSGKLPSGAKMTLDGHQFAADIANLTQAIVCDPLTAGSVIAGPIGPQGTCAGSEVAFAVRLKACECD